MNACNPIVFRRYRCLFIPAVFSLFALTGCEKGSLENLSEKDVDVPPITQQVPRYCCAGLETAGKVDQQTIAEIRRGLQNRPDPQPAK